MIPSSGRLETRLIRAFVLTAALPLLIAGLLISYTVVASVRQEAYQRQREVTVAEVKYISNFLQEIQRDLEGVGRIAIITKEDEPLLSKLHELMLSFVRNQQVCREISIMDRTGMEIVRVSRSGPVPASLLVRRDEEEKFFRAARGEVFYSWVRFADDGPIISLSIPLRSNGDNSPVEFVLSADIQLADIWDDIEAVQLGQSGYAFLVDRRGNLIAYHDEAVVRRNLGLAALPPVRDVLSGSTAGTVYEYRSLGGQAVLGTGARVDGPSWVVVVERPASEAYAPIQRMGLVAVGVLAGTCLVAILVGIALSRRITRPVAWLEQGARKLGSGELSHRIVVRTGDEIERLADEFNRMADSLEHSRREIEATSREREDLYRLKDEFIQNTSHELRTPLALIVGHAELLTSGELGEIPPEQCESLGVLTRRARDLTNMVEALTTILEAEAGAMVPVEVCLHEMVEQAAGDFQAVASKARLELRVEIEGVPPSIWADERHVRRAIDNLLSNAIKFTPPDGSVHVCVQGQTDGVRVEVSDTGIGIPQDKLDKVFERFYQVDGTARRRYGGVGLGLALVKEIVEAHHGQLGIASVVGQGTTAWFWLPCHASPTT